MPAPAEARDLTLNDRSDGIVAMFVAGKTITQIAKDLSCSRPHVSGVLRAAGFQPRAGRPSRSGPPRPRTQVPVQRSPYPLEDAPDAELRALYDRDGWSVARIAFYFDTTSFRTSRRLRSAGVRLRQHGGAAAARRELDTDRVARLYEAGASGVELAEELGVDTATIYARLDERQVRRRPLGRRAG